MGVPPNHPFEWDFPLPIGSMYGIYANIKGVYMYVNVTIYSSTMDPMGYKLSILGGTPIPLRSSKECGRAGAVVGTTSGAATRGGERGASGQGPVAAWWKNGGSWSKKKTGFFHVDMRKSPLLVGK